MPAELRPSQALRLWHDVTLDLVRDTEHDLSARQMAVLLTIYLDLPPHTVRGLAETLGVTKPAITRALDTMGRLGLVSRHRDPADRRNVVIQRTLAGALAVERLGDIIIWIVASTPSGRISPTAVSKGGSRPSATSMASRCGSPCRRRRSAARPTPAPRSTPRR